jgi:hypothetical protein
MARSEISKQDGGGGKLTARQLTALPQVAGARTIAEAAKQSGTGRATLHRWLQHPAFALELYLYQQEVMEASRAKLANHMMRAVDVLGELLQSRNDSIRRQAARDILTVVLHLEKHFEVVQRIEKVEEAVGLAEAVGVIK